MAHDAAEPKRLVANILRQLNQEVLAKLAVAGDVRHPAEGGRARENVLADALRQFLPDAYGVSTGFVIDALGNMSRQVDLIIYRRGYHPVFVVGGVSYFMVESVVAVAEHKASIRTRALLRDALDTLRSVKALDRTNRGTNYTVHGSARGETVTLDGHFHLVHTAILTESSLAEEALSEVALEFLRANDRHLWPNMYVDLTKFIGYYLKSDRQITDQPHEAAEWAILEPADEGVPPLVEYLSALANLLRVAPLVDYAVTGYLPRQTGQASTWPIAPKPDGD